MSRLVTFRQKIMACIEEQKSKQKENLEQFKILLTKVRDGSDIIAVGEALEVAGARGEITFVDAICSQRFVLQISQEVRNRTMSYAAQNNQVNILERMMLASCDQNRYTNVMARCLLLAVYEGHFDIVKLIFDKKADHISVTQLKSALKIAIEQERQSMKVFFKKKLQENLPHEQARSEIQDVKRVIEREIDYQVLTQLLSMGLNCHDQAESPSSEKPNKIRKGF